MSSTTLRMSASVLETSGDFFSVQLRMTALRGASGEVSSWRAPPEGSWMAQGLPHSLAGAPWPSREARLLPPVGGFQHRGPFPYSGTKSRPAFWTDGASA